VAVGLAVGTVLPVGLGSWRTALGPQALSASTGLSGESVGTAMHLQPVWQVPLEQ
jgi:hypothetical protein